MKLKKYTDLTNLATAAQVLFYDPEYLRVQHYKKLVGFGLEEPTEQKELILFNLIGNVAKSLQYSPFGSLAGDASMQSKMKLLTYAQEELSKLGIQKISITHPVALYGFKDPAPFFHSLGYETDYFDWNQHINLSHYHTNVLHKMERRRLDKGRVMGIECSKVSSSAVSEIHRFLSNCRVQKGLQINIELKKLENLMAAFPDKYALFTAKLNGELMAACITVQVSPSVAYYYLPGTDEKFQKVSPMVLLIDYICQHYQERGLQYLDLGVSSVDGHKQKGLFLFKERMGAEAHHKYQFSKVLK